MQFGEVRRKPADCVHGNPKIHCWFAVEIVSAMIMRRRSVSDEHEMHSQNARGARDFKVVAKRFKPCAASFARHVDFRPTEVFCIALSGFLFQFLPPPHVRTSLPKYRRRLWKEAGCTTEFDYTEQTSWLFF
jgi:hypothetical protein